MLRDEALDPLCPLRVAGFDDTQFLPLDGTQEQFVRFKETYAHPEYWTANGHLIIVGGDKGFGKTSLIQRCAAWLRDQPKGPVRCEIVSVDLSDEGERKTMPLSERADETMRFILTALGSRLTEDQHTELKKTETLHKDKFRKLGQMLTDRIAPDGKTPQPIVLLVVLRRYSTLEEIDQYWDYACRGLAFFAEAYENLERIKRLESRFNRMGVDTMFMGLDVLKAGDAGGLVTRIRSKRDNPPEVPSELIGEIEQRFIRRGMGAGELAKMASGALSIAQDSAEQELKEIHIAEYYRTAFRQGPRD
jgi:hypothetical protein